MQWIIRRVVWSSPFNRCEPKDQQPFQGLDFGPLLDSLVTTPREFAAVGEQGAITLDVRRTHEWELLLGIAIAGSGAFFKGVLGELGKQIAGSVLRQAQKLKAQSRPELRSGEATTKIDDAGQSAGTVTDLLARAIELGARVQVIIEPKG